MGDKQVEVGGGPATGLADNFVKFLQGGLQNGRFGAPKGQYAGQFPGTGNAGGSAQTTAEDAAGRAAPYSTTEGIGNVLDKFLNGDFGDQKYGVDTTGLKSNQGGGIDFSKFKLPGAIDLSGFNTDALKNFNSTITPGSDNAPSVTGNTDFQSLLAQLKASAGGGNVAGARPGDVNIGLGSVDLSPYTAQLDRAKNADKADLRARFGASGGAAFGTPGAVAEGNFDAATNAANASTLADIGLKQQGLNVQAAIGSGQINAQNYGTWLDSVTKSDVANKNALASGLDSVARAAGTDAANFVSMRGQDLQAKIASGQLSLDAISKATGLDLDALNAGIAQNKSIGDMLNTRAGIESNSQVQNRGMDIDALAKALGLDLSGQQLGENARQANQSAQGNTLNQLMNLLAQLSGKGISQRQTVNKPGLGSQILGGLTGIAGAVSPFAHGSGFGSGNIPTSGGSFQPGDIGDPFGSGFNAGGKVPENSETGHEDKDSLIAMLTPGEFVLNKHATKLLGEDFLHKFNTLTHKPEPKAKKEDGVKGLNAGGPASGPGMPDILKALLALTQKPDATRAIGGSSTGQSPF